MKIGILTYHRVFNYGATLQAIATRCFLEEMGHDVYYVDYFPENHQALYKLFSALKFKELPILQKIRYLYNSIKYYKNKKERISAYYPFLEKYILPFCRPISRGSYDAIIYGSDQIWRKQGGLNDSFDKYYFGGNGLLGNLHISYAASMGATELTEKDKEFIKSSLNKFSGVGVRESSLYELLISLNIKNCCLTVDPTLLFNSEGWDKILNTDRIITEKYVFYYRVRRSFSDDVIDSFCKSLGLRCIKVNSYGKPNGSTLHPNPSEFVSLIKHAEYVLTSSFHALAFSVIYHKEVFVSLASNSERLFSMMKILGIEDHFITYGKPIPSGVQRINYLLVDSTLEKYKADSMNFIVNNLKKASLGK